MKHTIPVEPDLEFIKALSSAEASSLKKCYQCATCSIACSLSQDERPFPRKEMLFASWGLKAKLMGNPDIWLCYNCGDCSTSCPRGARPSDVLAAIRKAAIGHYSKPGCFNALLNNPKLIPFLVLIPAAIIMLIGFLTGLINFNPTYGKTIFANFFSVLLIEIIFIPLSLFSAMIFLFGLKRFINDMNKHYEHQGIISPGKRINMVKYLMTMIKNIVPIMTHERFSDCSAINGKKVSHIMVSFSFVSLAFVAGAFAFAQFFFNSHAPYSQVNPIKILANFSGIALICGSLWLMRDRIRDKEKKSSYFDWYLLVLALFLGLTGMMTQLARLIDIPTLAYPVYFIHLILAFNLIAFVPYSKLAHVVYRTVAVTFDSYVRSQSSQPLLKKKAVPIKNQMGEYRNEKI
ncbi:MAG: quinone-interacting membrane-bound oxidoreductase complex subunit QmoC [Desulfobacula sp.]|jgi:quinone-modifying oxidoreductase subunit QmoC|nr:quinone-interacting membrane-bound oxidoreductase complex subunit QmoC [Desulfobacula sp.]